VERDRRGDVPVTIPVTAPGDTVLDQRRRNVINTPREPAHDHHGTIAATAASAIYPVTKKLALAEDCAVAHERGQVRDVHGAPASRSSVRSA